MTVFRQPRCGRCRTNDQHKSELLWSSFCHRAIQLKHFWCLTHIPGNETTHNFGTNRVQFIINTGHDAEIPATTQEPPEEVFILSIACSDKSSFSSDDVKPDDVINCPTQTSGQG